MKRIEYDVPPGMDLEDAFKRLLQLKTESDCQAVEYFAVFNGKIITSSMSVDEVYKTVLNTTKAEWDQTRKKEHEKIMAEEAEHQKAVPGLTEKWIAEGHKHIDRKYWEAWDKCVPIRLTDLYHGMELGCCIELIQMLNAGEDFSVINQKFNDQNHSGISHSLMCSMLKAFHEKGSEFVKFALPESTRRLLKLQAEKRKEREHPPEPQH